MHRLFIGIDPPFEVKDALMEIMGGVLGARWQDEEQLHCTLRFLGDKSPRDANDIAECLAGVSAKPVQMGLEGIGQFDRKGLPNALWIGVRPPDDIRKLQKKVTRSLESVGVPPEGRSYLPHITLARFSRGHGPLDAFMARHGGFRVPPFQVTDFCLYESRLTHEGAIYSIVERYDFAQGSLFEWTEPDGFIPPKSADDWVR